MKTPEALQKAVDYVYDKIVTFVISSILFLQLMQMFAPSWLDWLFNVLILVLAWAMAKTVKLGRPKRA